MILACCACGLWEHKYRAGCVGHDQSIWAERASGAQTLLKERYWDYNGIDMDYKMEETGMYDGTCACVHFWKTRLYWMSDDNGPNKRIMLWSLSVHALMDQGQDVCLCVFESTHVYECL